MVACLAIPIVSLGGALPFLFGFGVAYSCATIARDTSKPTGLRLALCIGITFVAWILLVVLVIGAAALQS